MDNYNITTKSATGAVGEGSKMVFRYRKWTILQAAAGRGERKNNFGKHMFPIEYGSPRRKKHFFLWYIGKK